MRSTLLALAACAAAGLAAAAGAALPGRLQPSLPKEWKLSGTLAVGHEYHLIREDPKTGGVQALVRFRKGFALQDHVHQHDETLIVLEGKLLVELENEEKTLSRGGYALIPAGAVHSLGATGWGDTVFILTTAGPFGVEKKPASDSTGPQ